MIFNSIYSKYSNKRPISPSKIIQIVIYSILFLSFFFLSFTSFFFFKEQEWTQNSHSVAQQTASNSQQSSTTESTSQASQDKDSRDHSTSATTKTQHQAQTQWSCSAQSSSPMICQTRATMMHRRSSQHQHTLFNFFFLNLFVVVMKFYPISKIGCNK